MHGDTVQGVYTVHVPDGYDPFRPTALIVLLHGAGGSGDGMLGMCMSALRDRDYIAVCPTAIQEPWTAPVNDSLIRALLDEAVALFNVDLNRVYIAGYLMGGFGTWHYGPKYCERFAGIGVLAGGGSNGLKKLRDTGTFVYLYHGGDDTKVNPANSQATAKRMLKDGNDFVYTQLPNAGHRCPRSVIEEMFAFFDRKRLVVKKRVQVRASSSFSGKQTRDEVKYLGRLRTR